MNTFTNMAIFLAQQDELVKARMVKTALVLGLLQKEIDKDPKILHLGGPSYGFVNLNGLINQNDSLICISLISESDWHFGVIRNWEDEKYTPRIGLFRRANYPSHGELLKKVVIPIQNPRDIKYRIDSAWVDWIIGSINTSEDAVSFLRMLNSRN